MTPRKPHPAKRPAPLTWADATVEATPQGWRFTMPVPERVNAVWRQYKGRTIVSAKHRADKAVVGHVWPRITPLRGDVAVSITWYRARKAGDVDGRIKSALDLLRGIAYADDAQVADVRAVRIDDPTERARLVVDVWPIGARQVAA